MSTTSILVSGSKGRMGQAIIECAGGDDDVEIVSQIDIDDSITDAIAPCHTVIDFSSHLFTNELVEACLSAGKSLVIGTTGHTAEELAIVEKASSTIGIVMAPNYSVGVNTLFWLTRKATEILGTDFDLEVLEMHHRLKIDAPSGTAKRLAEILTEVRELDYERDTRHGRKGDVGARTDTEVGVHAIRGGDLIGDHTVIYAGSGERIELTHKASNRNTFANGSLRAAKWLAARPADLYDMQDVLGLKN